MFELKTITEAELTTFVGRTQKEGKEDVPAVSIRLRLIGVRNEMLDMLSPTLRSTIYTTVPGQEDLPGVEPSTPLLRSKDLTHAEPEFRYEGWRCWVARGLNDDALQMEKCKIDDFSLTFYEGGKVDIDWRLSTADIDEEGAGMLWSRQKRKVFVRILAPELPEQKPVIDGSVEAFKADFPDATDLFAGGDGGGGPPEGEDDEGAAADIGLAEERAEAARGSDGWPFPRGESAGDEQGVDEPETRANAGDAAGAEPAIPDAPKPRARRSKKAAAEVE